MSSDKGSQTDGEQIFDTENSDTSADAESTTNEQETDSTDEEIKDNLDLDEDKKDLSKGDREKAKQLDVWHKRVASGEVNINELPANLKWLKPQILERLDAVQKVPEIERLVEQKMVERESNAKFVSLKETLNHQRLTAEQRRELTTEFKDLRESGLSKDKALSKAMRIVGIELNQDTESEDLRSAMKLPAAGSKPRVKSDPLTDIEGFRKLDGKSRIAKLEEMRKRER